MKAPMPAFRTSTFASFVAAFCLVQPGCSGSNSESEPPPGAYAASGGIPATADREQIPSPAPSPDTGNQLSPAPTQSNHERVAAAASPAGSQEEHKSSIELRPLKPDLPPEKLIEFLAGADRDMQLIYSGRSGITDPQEARDTLMHFVKMKLEASRRLSDHPDADDAARSEGARGQLQGLSHLASLGDLKSAQQLEKLATSSVHSADAELAADSRLVLIGFAIESLQNGEERAADRIVGHIKQIAAAQTPADVPALMTMGQARESLASYGHEAHAQQVRELILDLFADSPQPEIAQMAAQMAGNVQFDTINRLLGIALRGQTVSADQWGEAVRGLIDESADLQTVRYLAGSALEFESLGLDELANVTYEVLTTRFDDPDSATAREVKTAIDARQARRDVIGWAYDLKLPSTDGASLTIGDYRGKVVLMPFWTMSSPESLQLVPRLKAIRDSYTDEVTIVGMNLDGDAAPLDQFLQTNDLGFPSFRAQQTTVANETPVAVQFGVVSMPFAAILDPQGRVAAITLTGRDLEKTVAGLVER
jgi:hypothetical protein